jgi:hypothetical protein
MSVQSSIWRRSSKGEVSRYNPLSLPLGVLANFTKEF